MSWKPEFMISGKWYDNAQRFETEQEAKDSAAARFAVWTMPTDHRATESTDPANYVRANGLDNGCEPKKVVV